MKRDQATNQQSNLHTVTNSKRDLPPFKTTVKVVNDKLVTDLYTEQTIPASKLKPPKPHF
jgi:hypothetical protein